MTNSFPPFEFQLPEGVHPRIRSFYQLWLESGDGELPASDRFDIEALSKDYPLLASIGFEDADRTFRWREVAPGAQWPFKSPVKGRQVIDSVRAISVKRVLGTLRDVFDEGIPDYYETMSWMYGGRTRALARLVVPVAGTVGRELIVLWEAMDPMES